MILNCHVSLWTALTQAVYIRDARSAPIKTADDKHLTELKDKKGKEGEFTFNLNPESELATKHRSADTTITIRKTLDGNKLWLKATINVPKIVKDTEYIPWKDDKEAFLKKEVEKKRRIVTGKQIGRAHV